MKIFKIADYLLPQLRVTYPLSLLTLIQPGGGQNLLSSETLLGIFTQHVQQELLAGRTAFVPYRA
jgi:hypothetical protein